MSELIFSNFDNNNSSVDPTYLDPDRSDRKAIYDVKAPAPEVGDTSAYNTIKSQRKARRQFNKTTKNAEATALQALAAETDAKYQPIREARTQHAIDTSLAKQASREGFSRRHTEKQLAMSLTRDIRSPELTLNNRVRLYGKNHKCEHGMKFNCIKRVGDHEFSFSCDCNQSDIKCRVTNPPCVSCGNIRTSLRHNRVCGCTSHLCRKCHTCFYLYDYNEAEVVQFYDKHSPHTNAVTITINRYEDVVDSSPSFEEYLAKHQVTTPKAEQTETAPPTISGAGYAAVASGAAKAFVRKPSPAGGGTFRAELLKRIKASKLAQVETIPEGGTISSLSTAPDAARKGIRGHLTSLKEKITTLIEGMILKFGASRVGKFISNKLRTLTEGLGYTVNVILDYIMCVSPLHIVSIISDFRCNNKAGMLATFAMMLLEMRDAEMSAKDRILHVLHVFQLSCANENSRRPLPKFEDIDMGPLKTIMLDYLAKHDKINTTQFIKKVKDFGMGCASQNYRYMDAVSTIPEMNLDFLTEMLKSLPRRFGSIIKPLSEMAKLILPILMLTKVSVDVGKIVKTVIDYVHSWISGDIKDTKLWIRHEIEADGSPLNTLYANYLAYQLTCSGATGADSATAMRVKYYTCLAEAEVYIATNKRYGRDWSEFKRHLESGMQSIPPLKSRDFEPTCFVLSGPAGKGKSAAWRSIVGTELGCKTFEEVQAKTYTWNTTSEYQTGISGKDVILFDDFYQDKKAGENLALIGLITTAPMAAVTANIAGSEIKGMQVDPKVVVLCTNSNPDHAGQDLTSPDALARRFDLEIELFKRVNFEDLDAPIGQVKRCVEYEHIIGTQVNLAQARSLFSLIHRKKRESFRHVTDNMEKTLELEPTGILPQTTPAPENLAEWQKQGDFAKDLDRLVLNPTMLMEVEEEPEPKKESKLSSFKAKVKSVFTTKESGNIDELIAISKGVLLEGALLAVPVVYVITMAKALSYVYSWFGVKICKMMGLRSTISAVIAPAIKCIMATLTTIGISFAAYKLFSAVSESGTTKTAKPRSPGYLSTKPEAGDLDQLNPLFKKATGSIRTSLGTTVNCVFIGGHYVLTVRHIFVDTMTGSYIPNGTEFFINTPLWKSGEKPFLFNQTQLVPLSHGNTYLGDKGYRADVILFKLDERVFSAHKNIVKHFWHGDYDLTNFRVEKIDLMGYQQDGSYSTDFQISSGKVTRDQIRTTRLEGRDLIYHVVAESDYDSRPSSCGSLVRLSETQEEVLLGVHVARGLTKYSYFHFVTSDSLLEALERDQKAVIDIDMTQVDTTAECAVTFLPEKTSLVYLGEVEHRVYQNMKTSLTPSDVYEALGPHITEPSPLGGYDERIPLKYQGVEFYRQLFSGYIQRPGAFLPEELTAAADSLRSQFQGILSKSVYQPRKLNLHQAVNGIKGKPANTRMDMTTSCGYPYVCEGLKKSDLFEDWGDVLVPGARVEDDYRRVMKQIEEGTIPFSPFILTIKDERIKLAKIATPKSRIFACGNVINFLVCRSYFYTFMMSMYHADVHELFFRPSLDRLSLDWHEYASYMTEVGDHGFDFDYKFYDRTLSHLLLYKSAELMLTGLNLPEREQATLLEWICSPQMIWRKSLFTSQGINMSGILITYTINCISNEIMHRAAWTHLSRIHRPNLVEMSSYRKYTRGMRGGDDTITVVHSHVDDWYNGVSVSEFLNERGLEVTSPQKNAEIRPLTSFFDMSFLKNQTRSRFGYFIPLPELESLVESCYWIRLNRYNKDAIKATQENIICSLRGIFFHGPSVYDPIRDKFLSKCPLLQLPTYEELSAIWLHYFRFPGAHSDYATRDEDRIGNSEASPHPYKGKPGIQPTPKMNIPQITTISPAITIPEAGALDNVTNSDFAGASLPSTSLVAQAVESSHAPSEVAPLPAQQAGVDSLSGAERSVRESVGTTITDGAQMTSLNPSLGAFTPSSQSKRAMATMNDTDWTLAKLEKKFTYIQTVNWPATAVPSTNLLTLDIPNDVIVTAAQKAPFDTTNFYKFSSITIKIVIKASPFYAGCLVAGFIPYTTAMTTTQLVQNNGVLIKLSQDESVEYNIPFRFHKGYLRHPESLGSFQIKVMSRLATGPDNPQSVPIAIYSAIQDAVFKVPEVIPATAYYSHKFDKGSSFVITHPESGTSFAFVKDAVQKTSNDNEVKCLVTNINTPVHEMDLTVLCAGEGYTKQVLPSHFQDSPDDLLTLFKRFRRVGKVIFNSEPDTTKIFSMTVENLALTAAGILPNCYVLWRGSIVLRASLVQHKAGENVFPPQGYVRINVGNQANAPGFDKQDFSGIHSFDANCPAQVVIPYLARTFTSPFGQTGAGDNHYVTVECVGGYGDYSVEFDIALGDDFHAGLYYGLSSTFGLTPLTIFASKKANKKQQQVGNIVTIAESGVIEFIDRAIETALPIAEKVSKLGSLLDAHMIQYQPYPIQHRTRPLGIACDLHNYKETLTTVNHNGMSLPDEQAFGMNAKETSIKNLLTSVKQYQGTIVWNEAQVSGTQLASYTSGPTRGGPGILDQLPYLFNYWSGGTVLIFDIIATEMHRGQLMFSYSPTGKVAANLNEASQTYFTTFDLSKGRGTIAIMLPYLSPYPYSKVGDSNDPIPEGIYPGLLQVFVQNVLRSTKTVAPNIDIMVYKTYAKDFSVACFANNTIPFQ